MGELLAAAQREARARLEHEVGVAVATLLERYREAYRARKEAELALDFDDLQERACELLERAEIGAEVRERFDLVLVDEFQDTNGLQCRLLDALVGPDCQRVFVGDACQSIYRFRYADVELFRARGRARRAAPAADRELPLAPRAAGGHRPRLRPALRRARLRAAARAAHGRADRASRRSSCTSSRAARERRARLRRARSRRTRWRGACASSWTAACSPGGIAVLLRSARDASTYAAALERVGLVARSQLGRGFYRSQQVRDLCAYLALLRNRFDDHALLVVLASPLVGVSNDGLSALRTAAQRALYWPIELGQLEGLPERDRALVERFKELYDGLVRASGELGLAALLERIVAEHDYDLACLTAPDGERRFGNVRKLVRAARAYERDRGPDLAGFVEQMRLCDARDLSEADAPPGGGEEAVALMTIHAAKGLEFPVVCVPDLSRSTPAETGAVAVGPDGEVGLRLRDARGKVARRARLRAPRGRRQGGRGGRGRSRRLRRLDARARPAAARRLAGRPATASCSACSASSASSAPRSSPASPTSTSRARRCACTSTRPRTSHAAAGGARAAGRGAGAPARGPAQPLRRRARRRPARRSAPRCRSRSRRCRRRRCTCRARSPTARSPCTTAAASRTTPSA